jgi:hypothetical protein
MMRSLKQSPKMDPLNNLLKVTFHGGDRREPAASPAFINVPKESKSSVLTGGSELCVISYATLLPRRAGF